MHLSKIKSKKCRLLYDTGVSGIDLDSTFVSNNKINLKDIIRKGITYRSNEFTKTVNYSVVRDWYKYSGDVCQGILGGSFFEDYIIEIDYKNQLINLYNQDYKIDTDYQRLNTHHLLKDLNFYKYFTTPLTLKLANDKIITGDFLIDTGSSRNITLIKDLRLYNSKIVVASIVNNELFKDIDIKLNDEILKINGVDISLIDFESIKKLKKSVGIKMSYTIKRKRKIIEIETIVQKII